MVFHSTNPHWAKNIIESFCKYQNSSSANIELLSIDTTNEQDLIFIIPIYGEEELSDSWVLFFEKFARQKSNIGKNLYIYFSGVYDFEINDDITILKQIKYITKYLSVNIYIYPVKLEKNRVDINHLIYFYNHSNVFYNKKDSYQNIIQNLIFDTKLFLVKNTKNEVIDFTSKEDEYSSVFYRLEMELQESYLEKILLYSKYNTMIINRLNLDNLVNIISQQHNGYIKNISLKSNKIKLIPNMMKFISLEIVNFTANNIQEVNLALFPNTIKKINISKNNISQFKINSIYKNIIRVSLFNNQLKDISNLDKLPNLKYLNIGLNLFSELPKGLFLLKKLEHLNIALLKIEQISEQILNMESLSILDITGSYKLQNSNIIKKLKKKGVKIIC